MSSGYPPQDHNQTRQQQLAMMKNIPPANVGAQAPAQAPVSSPAARNPTAPPVHVESLDKVSGLQTRRPFFEIRGTLDDFEKGKGIATRATLSHEFIEGMKRPIVTRNRHQATGAQRVGDPAKTVIKRIHLGKAYNPTNKVLVGHIDGMFPEGGAANGSPANFTLPPTPNGPIDLNITLEEPINVLTDHMLKFKGPLAGSKYEIIPDPDPRAEYWALKLRNEITDANGKKHYIPTFAAAFMAMMVADGAFPKKGETVAKAIEVNLKDPSVHQLTLPKDMLIKVRDEMQAGERDIDSALNNLYEWGIDFRTHDGSAFTDQTNAHGINASMDLTTRPLSDESVNKTSHSIWVEASMDYGMLLGLPGSE